MGSAVNRVVANPDPHREGISQRPAMPPKPRILPPNVDEIPADLRNIPAWVGWRLVQDDVRWTKEPVNIRTGGLAKSDNPATWVDFQTAVAGYKRLGCDGIGLCRTGDYLFIDLDGCLDANGKVLFSLTWAAKILPVLRGRAYAETSPSGTGIHAICRGKLPPGRRQFDEPGLDHTGFALYAANRFFTFTGHQLQASGPIEDLTAELTKLHQELFPPKPSLNGSSSHNGHHVVMPGPLSLSDAELLERACRAANGPTFSRL
jgi:putative DNA primase/helicase